MRHSATVERVRDLRPKLTALKTGMAETPAAVARRHHRDQVMDRVLRHRVAELRRRYENGEPIFQPGERFNVALQAAADQFDELERREDEFDQAAIVEGYD